MSSLASRCFVCYVLAAVSQTRCRHALPAIWVQYGPSFPFSVFFNDTYVKGLDSREESKGLDSRERNTVRLMTELSSEGAVDEHITRSWDKRYFFHPNGRCESIFPT